MLPFVPKSIASVKTVIRGGRDSSINEKVQKQLHAFAVDDEKLRHVMALLLQEMERGLSKEHHTGATVKMLPSYVRSVPNGTEVGNFLALDLGGTNFRVLLIRLRGKTVDMASKIFRVPHEVMIGSGTKLFDHIADCLAMFMREHDLVGHKLPLGFTFSFPCEQHGLTSATLINWTKGFKASNVEGADVVKLLQEAVHRRKDVDIDVVALLNDTTGTLMACAHSDNNCNVGVIVGTGTNACYMERVDRVTKLDFESKQPPEVIINTEWGAFGDNGCLDFVRTPFDQEIDRNSINPGRQIFEKMISGMYLGELVRLVLEKMTKDGLLFGGQGSADLFTRGKFPTKFVSEIEADLDDDERMFTNTMQVLEDLGLEGITPHDCQSVAHICAAVTHRAAYLCAAGIAVLLNRMEKPDVTVGIDGSVYRFHPSFKTLLDKKVGQLIHPGLKYRLMLSEDGSGVGAALVAAVATRVAEELRKKS